MVTCYSQFIFVGFVLRQTWLFHVDKLTSCLNCAVNLANSFYLHKNDFKQIKADKTCPYLFLN
jgi:hypothetical protein